VPALQDAPRRGRHDDPHLDRRRCCELWDIGGQAKIRPLWRHYYDKSKTVVFVVDAGDADAFDEARGELATMLESEALRAARFVVVANKQDLPGALSCDALADAMRLPGAFGERPYTFVGASVADCEPLRNALLPAAPPPQPSAEAEDYKARATEWLGRAREAAFAGAVDVDGVAHDAPACLVASLAAYRKNAEAWFLLACLTPACVTRVVRDKPFTKRACLVECINFDQPPSAAAWARPPGVAWTRLAESVADGPEEMRADEYLEVAGKRYTKAELLARADEIVVTLAKTSI
jgi:hypothetical protein